MSVFLLNLISTQILELEWLEQKFMKWLISNLVNESSSNLEKAVYEYYWFYFFFWIFIAAIWLLSIYWYSVRLSSHIINVTREWALEFDLQFTSTAISTSTSSSINWFADAAIYTRALQESADLQVCLWESSINQAYDLSTDSSSSNFWLHSYFLQIYIQCSNC